MSFYWNIDKEQFGFYAHGLTLNKAIEILSLVNHWWSLLITYLAHGRLITFQHCVCSSPFFHPLNAKFNLSSCESQNIWFEAWIVNYYVSCCIHYILSKGIQTHSISLHIVSRCVTLYLPFTFSLQAIIPRWEVLMFFVNFTTKNLWKQI